MFNSYIMYMKYEYKYYDEMNIVYKCKIYKTFEIIKLEKRFLRAWFNLMFS